MEAINDSAHIDPNLIFRAREPGLFEEDTLYENEITPITDGETVPDFIDSIKEKLQAKRSITPAQRV